MLVAGANFRKARKYRLKKRSALVSLRFAIDATRTSRGAAVWDGFTEPQRQFELFRNNPMPVPTREKSLNPNSAARNMVSPSLVTRRLPVSEIHFYDVPW